ncbi:MAG TPA: imidazole glycerol phosphate synthase subunit HisH [Elusimicrobia bacterium]|nr:imidazole glycerol phosphate synthase subunit HisH [Elusimicrobiota bacterium]
MIAIIDYGLGNLKSIYNALSKLGIPARVTSDKKIIEQAERVILPGVGAFAQGMRNLKDLGLIPVIRQVVKENKHFLGICLGLQLLFSESEEHGRHKGLDIIKGKVKKFTQKLKIPHMGWNAVHYSPLTTYHLPLFRGVPDGSYFYFVHSYYVVPKDKNIILATTDYSEKFVSVVGRGNLFGVQFHPERSGPLGLRILKNFSSY